MSGSINSKFASVWREIGKKYETNYEFSIRKSQMGSNFPKQFSLPHYRGERDTFSQKYPIRLQKPKFVGIETPLNEGNVIIGFFWPAKLTKILGLQKGISGPNLKKISRQLRSLERSRYIAHINKVWKNTQNVFLGSGSVLISRL